MPSWLSDLVGPRLREIVSGGEEENVGDPICERCGHPMSRDNWRAARQICGACGYYRLLPVVERLDLLFADGSDQVIEAPVTRTDPLKFRDQRRYAERLREAEEHTGRPEAVTVAHGRIGEEQAVVAVIDPEFLDGTISCGVGDGLVAASRLAVIQEAALVVVSASCGLRLQEGVLALAQIDRIAVAIDDVRQVGLPCIAILPAGATGTVAATLAALADLVIAEPDAAPPSPTDGRGRSGDPEPGLAEPPGRPEGLPADLLVERTDLPDVLARLLGLIRRPRPSAEVLPLLPPEASTLSSLDDVRTAIAARRDPR